MSSKKRDEATSSGMWAVAEFSVCFLGLQSSYLMWGYMQEKVMTTEYTTGMFPSATFAVFSNRVFAICLGLALSVHKHRTLRLPAPFNTFAPSSISNSLSSYGQYQALHFVSFQLQTLSKSTKVVPVMLMGKCLNKATYPWIEYFEAVAIAVGISIFSLSEKASKATAGTETVGILLLVLYIACDSFTAQWQGRIFLEHPTVNQFQMMYATNLWSVIFTIIALLVSGEFFVTLAFLAQNPAAVFDNLVIATTSATGQLFIFRTIRRFGPVAFTIIMTTRQMLSMVLSSVAFGHVLHFPAYLGSGIVFATAFSKVMRSGKKKERAKVVPEKIPPAEIIGSESNSKH